MAEIVLIAAVARNGSIGRDNALVFSEPADRQHFRAATMGHPVVMGRKTWDSLPARFRPLPGRRNVVISRDAELEADGADVATGLGDALQLLADAPRICVIGGAQIYAQALPLAHELLLTEVDSDLEGDRFFPSWNRAEFELVSQQPAQTAAGINYRFARYRRKP